MGKLEEQNRKTVRRTEIQETILATIYAAGIIGVAVLAPNVIGALDKIGLLPYSRQRETIKSSANRLKKNGFLKFKDGYYSLTENGEKLLQQWQKSDYKIEHPKKWDRKWRVLIFDIPEKKRLIRTEIRSIFISAGFKRLQDSVWVFPYDCEDIISLLKTDYGIRRDLLYIIADQIENDKYLREEFRLQK